MRVRVVAALVRVVVLLVRVVAALVRAVPCHWDRWAGRRLGGAVSLGLPERAVWAAPCHWNCWAGRRLGEIAGSQNSAHF